MEEGADMSKEGAMAKSTLIFEKLKSELLSLDIKPGEEISEAEVCERFSVTRPIARLVFRRLCDAALVDIQPYKGVYATRINLDNVCQFIQLRITVESQVIRDFMDSRPSDLVYEDLEHYLRMQKLLLKEKTIDRNKFFQYDCSLHQYWFKYQHCDLLWTIIHEQNPEYFRFRILDLLESKDFTHLVHDHEQLVDGMRMDNPESVKLALGKHLTHGIQKLYDQM